MFPSDKWNNYKSFVWLQLNKSKLTSRKTHNVLLVIYVVESSSSSEIVINGGLVLVLEGDIE